ncbi:GNAT family N-acetyltransferase [Simkania negevensis]|uniref:GNAT family N-acetyltransferase n=1 Tax=Simkania negevensis TaxID=83561 RepID=A0ABS3AUP1_9BACT|nr:GNAT family N-acetyltransferase [Simkania negevensis]
MKNDLISFELARPLESHAKAAYALRNDPDTLRFSFHPQEKTWKEFLVDYRARYFQYPDLPSLFVLYEGKRCGLLRFAPCSHPLFFHKKCCDISIMIAPEHRGQGIASSALRLASEQLTKQGIDTVVALIKPENAASCTAFERARFSFVDTTVHTVPDTKDLVSVHRYTRELQSSQWSRGRVFIIAEAGSNWRMGCKERDIAMAKALIDVALDSGADAVKFQTYRPETVYVDNAGKSRYLEKGGIDQDIREIFADLAMPYEMVPIIAEYSKKQGIAFMSTPFSKQDFEAVDPFVSIHKIASYEISHVRLLECAARSGKPLILSTGASTEEDIAWAVDTFYDNGGKDLILMQCTAKYPAPPDSLNLRSIPWLKKRFGCPTGLSDHSRNPILAPVVAVALGASVIEKHYTLNNSLPGPDHSFAVEPKELTAMVKAIREAEEMLGVEEKKIERSEEELHAFARRGIQAIRLVRDGEVLQEGVNIDILRPGQQCRGIHPKHLIELEGKKATKDIPLGAGIANDDWER